MTGTKRGQPKDEIIALEKELKRKTPPTESRTSPTTDTPQLQRFTAQEKAVNEEIMEVILRNKLTADHAKTLIGRTIQYLELG